MKDNELQINDKTTSTHGLDSVSSGSESSRATRFFEFGNGAASFLAGTFLAAGTSVASDSGSDATWADCLVGNFLALADSFLVGVG